ncbi:MAG: DUF885 domain-containing protein [Sterolibacterium sp.]|nr:DUF885 domain-containing protein [Sterolibacterium sp.]
MSARLIFGLTLLASTAVSAAPSATNAWVAISNVDATQVFEAQAKFSPEDASNAGLAQYDGLSADLGPNINYRHVSAMQAVHARLKRRLQDEKDSRVRQDLEILMSSIDNEIAEIRLEEKYNLPWVDVPQLMFSSLQSLLQEQLPAARRAKALERLQRYVGLTPHSIPLTEQAKARFMEKRGKPGLQGPVRARLDISISNVPTYIKGIRDLFTTMKIAGAEPALAAMEKQLTEYAAWERAQVLPVTREDFRLPPELYALRLKRAGIDIEPRLLIQRAQVGYMETRAAMQALAPVVAKAKGIDATDYRAVIRIMKQDAIPNDQLEARYKEINTALEAAIRRERIVDVPNRPMIMRLASAAESAAEPAPHFLPPPLIGNAGEQGQFVLPLGNPVAGDREEAYDDFNYPGAAWTMSAHEGRPGHELQFSAMVERGVSQARMLYAFNSVNVEGWALYAEAEMIPSEPPEGQMIALQLRLLRAARAMLDPMLNLGLISREDAGRVLTQEVILSAPMARQELDRYTFNSPGQAGSYFYGYSRILQLRAETELALGANFDRQAFNNFLIDQGLLPPDLLAKAVREKFIPTQKMAIRSDSR